MKGNLCCGLKLQTSGLFLPGTHFVGVCIIDARLGAMICGPGGKIGAGMVSQLAPSEIRNG